MDLYQIRRQRRRRRRRRQRAIVLSIFSILAIGLSILLAGALKAKSGASGETTEAPIQTTEVQTVTMAAIQAVEVTAEPTEAPRLYKMHLSKKDSYLLAKIAMAEAEGEPLKGKELVIMVVLNRMQSKEFPDTVYDVIYQEHQFSPIADGRFDRVEPDEDCWKALEKVKAFENDISEGALYFENCACDDNWHSRNLKFLFECGNHKFYK